MNQALWDVSSPAVAPPIAATGASTDAGFDIGWDHARHGLVPSPGLVTGTTSLGQGWRAGKAVFSRRTAASSRATRNWLALRTDAWLLGVPFDSVLVTPAYLALIDVVRCPVFRVPLGGAAGQPDAAAIVQLNPRAGFSGGNLAVMSRRAAALSTEVDIGPGSRRAHAREQDVGADAAAWERLAALRSYTTPLPFGDALQMAMTVLPPPGVGVVNAPQRLQALVTGHFAASGWSARTRELAALMPAHTLRHDFLLFVGALAPRIIEADRQPTALRIALEDAWLNERVQRRWQHFMRCLGEAGTVSLLARAARPRLDSSPGSAAKSPPRPQPRRPLCAGSRAIFNPLRPAVQRTSSTL